MQLFYLKPTIIAEPLIWGWYAWSYLIPPTTAGCYLSDRYVSKDNAVLCTGAPNSCSSNKQS
jgi:hypothetical protein